MVTATDLKTGVSFLMNGKPYVVIKYAHQKIGRGGATVKLTVRNLATGIQEEKSFSSANKFDEIATQKKKLQYLYQDEDNAIFMDPKTFEQTEISLDILGEDVKYIKDGDEVNVLFWNPPVGGQVQALSVEIPPKVELKVVETAPGVKGNSATNIYKPAKLENGVELKVPLFIKTGETIRVDTRTGEYVERVAS